MAVMNIKPQKFGGLSSTIKVLLLCIYLLASYRQRVMFTSSITKQMRPRPLSSAYILSVVDVQYGLIKHLLRSCPTRLYIWSLSLSTGSAVAVTLYVYSCFFVPGMPLVVKGFNTLAGWHNKTDYSGVF